MQTVPLGISMEILKVYRGPSTDSDGMTGICMQDTDGTQAEMVAVDLQWFVLYCDKNRPAKDTCDEFFETTTQIDYLPADEDVTSFPPLDVDEADLIPDPVGLKAARECGRCREEEIDDLPTTDVPAYAAGFDPEDSGMTFTTTSLPATVPLVSPIQTELLAD